jgi:putative Mg2+ transporter-C (MgtC) family protein
MIFGFDVVLEYALRLSLALVCGLVIGFNREKLQRPAGLRTHALIAVGSAFFTVLSVEYFGKFFGGDPGRLTAQIIAGIGFLGAGTIVKRGFSVTGLTTAATLWVSAAIGVGFGVGEFLLSGFMTVAVLLTLTVVKRIGLSLSKNKTRFIIELVQGKKGFQKIIEWLLENKIPAGSLYFETDGELVTISIRVDPDTVEKLKQKWNELLDFKEIRSLEIL